MINLVIDIGNTRSKIALFNNRDLIRAEQVVELSASYLSSFLKHNEINNSVIASVKSNIKQLEAQLKLHSNYFQFTATSASKIKNRYKTPNTLGLDRYAALIGAQVLYPEKNCLIIDAGTCITYDFLSLEMEYLGGSISPGIQMRFKALQAFTDKLPLIDPDWENNDDYGQDTKSSILTGVQRGIIFEALGFINAYFAKWPDIKVLLCGGDVKFFDTQLKSSIFAHTLKTEPHLVLIGLNEVIHYNND